MICAEQAGDDWPMEAAAARRVAAIRPFLVYLVSQ